MRIKAMGIVGLCLTGFLTLGLVPDNGHFGAPSQVMAQEVSPANPFDGKTHVKKKKAKPATAEKSTSPPKKTISRPSNGNSRTQAIQRALDTVTSIDYVDMPFVDIKRDLEDKYGINIVLDASAIDDSLTEEELITFRVMNIKLKHALTLMLRDFNATYVNKDEVIRIISLDNVGDPENFVKRIVGVKSLLQTIGRIDTRTSDSNSATSPESLLIRTITSVVHPDQWATSGKGEAAIEIIGGVLVMRGPEFLMDEATHFIKDLEAEILAQD